MSGSIVITGGCGFLGAALAQRIVDKGVTLPDGRHLAAPQVQLWDLPNARVPVLPNVTFNAIDITDKDAVVAAMPDDIALVYHLAAVVSGQAEADYDLGMKINLGGTNTVLEAVKEIRPGVPVIGTSSLAVYGGNPQEPLSEATQIQPQNTYGVTKAMAELVMADYRRRGWVDARTLRLPTITVRPGTPNAAASSFASSIIREPLGGVPAICPVHPDMALWVASPDAAVAALWHAPSVSDDDWPAFGAVNVPGLQVQVFSMIAALRARAGDGTADLIEMKPDQKIIDIVGTWPTLFDTSLAQSLGFQGDAGFDAILDQAFLMK
ncbi:D-erythronate dehydrogenase [Roseobacter sp. CCS2]|uniref:D-erythronate dehydrogenase n=1 Tax=Roseobacter sp. CCS2 TaxID=391593 RepID=UPI0000F3C636|nr:D-erythronate dehydrogenase [Roseobacter sp. CCS2]EBA11859.1 NAD-dependent epimerase/dehydratase:Short-chain dehydrogenase/reductase SDR:3-beta hydroxysteroid [Roseobacter sp. CCS2]